MPECASLSFSSVLLTFFEVPFGRKQQLARCSLLATLGLAAKLDTLGYILGATGLGDTYGTVASNTSDNSRSQP